MNTVNITSNASKDSNQFDTLIIRIALLIGEKTMAGGDLYMVLNFDEVFKDIAKSHKDKLRFLIDISKDKPNEDKAYVKEMEELMIFYKSNSAVKNKNRDQVINQKRIEKYIDAIYTNETEGKKDYFAEKGLIQLTKFVNNGLFIANVHPHAPESEEPTSVKLSTILLSKFKHSRDDIYLVSGYFKRFLTEHNFHIGSLTSTNKDKRAQVLRAENCLTFPMVNHLSFDEMEFLRQQFLNSFGAFRLQMYNWSLELSEMTYDHSYFDSLVKYFKNNIESHFKPIQDAIENSDSVYLANTRTKGLWEIHLNIYVCQVSVYWDYLKSVDKLKEETIIVLNGYDGIESLKSSCCIILESEMIKNNTSTDTEDEPKLTKRKTLDI